MSLKYELLFKGVGHEAKGDGSRRKLLRILVISELSCAGGPQGLDSKQSFTTDFAHQSLLSPRELG